MIRLSDQKLLGILDAQLHGATDFECNGVEIDSRRDCSGRLFIAIAGDNFDGHDFVAAAADKGAVAALVERRLEVSIPQLVVSDCRMALAQLATAWRRMQSATVIAITGSNGKTTVKEMLGRILSSQASTLVTAGNLNNELGVPLTLLRLSPRDRYAVIEMGANHVGEIRRLVEIAEPDIVYVNNARPAHVEGFGSLEKIVEAKGEMYRHCPADALAVFNADEPSLALWLATAATDRRLTFSMQTRAEVRGSFRLRDRSLELEAEYHGEQGSVLIQLAGAHNAQNALAAITLALAAGITLEDAMQGLEGFSGVSGRQQFKTGPRGCLVIDDSYNANPDSLAAAVDVLCSMPGRPWLALGDMAELGPDTQALHDQAASQAQARGVEQFFGLGEKSSLAARQFGANGFGFDEHRQMAQFIADRLSADVNLLVKGSRSAHMERLVDALVDGRTGPAPAGEPHAV